VLPSLRALVLQSVQVRIGSALFRSSGNYFAREDRGYQHRLSATALHRSYRFAESGKVWLPADERRAQNGPHEWWGGTLHPVDRLGGAGHTGTGRGDARPRGVRHGSTYPTLTGCPQLHAPGFADLSGLRGCLREEWKSSCASQTLV